MLSMLAALLLALSGCAAAKGQEEGPVLWFTGDLSDWENSSYSAMDTVSYGGDLSVEAMMNALLAGPDRDSGLTSPFPAGTRLLGWKLDADGLLWVDLSDDYGSLAGIRLTLADYCITMTLSQIPGVERVSVTVSGRQLSYRYRQELEPGQVVLSGAEERPVEKSAVLYFPRAAGRGLGFETRVFQVTEDDVFADVVTRALLSGPQEEELTSVIPEGTQLISAKVEDGVCVLDFSKELLGGMPESAEGQTLLIYSIVNTLGNLESVDAVRFQAEGEDLTAYGAVELSGPLEPDFGLVGND